MKLRSGKIVKYKNNIPKKRKKNKQEEELCSLFKNIRITYNFDDLINDFSCFEISKKLIKKKKTSYKKKKKKKKKSFKKKL